jgi:hypothetical protein
MKIIDFSQHQGRGGGIKIFFTESRGMGGVGERGEK